MNADTVYEGVFLPTDHSEAGILAFYHGLKLALSARIPLRLLHVRKGDTRKDVNTFPKVRATLSRWGDRAIATSDLVEMGLSIRKEIVHSDDPANAILARLRKNHRQLAVLAPHSHGGLEGIFHHSISNEVARKTRAPALFVPEGSLGFVRPEDGSLDLEHILFPVDYKPDPQAALDLAESISQDLALARVTGHLLHVGNEEVHCFPSILPRWSWQRHFHEGEPAATILEKASSLNCRLIVMTTEGRHGLLDNVRGSVTERVIKQAPCPVLILHQP